MPDDSRYGRVRGGSVGWGRHYGGGIIGVVLRLQARSRSLVYGLWSEDEVAVVYTIIGWAEGSSDCLPASSCVPLSGRVMRISARDLRYGDLREGRSS